MPSLSVEQRRHEDTATVDSQGGQSGGVLLSTWPLLLLLTSLCSTLGLLFLFLSPDSFPPSLSASHILFLVRTVAFPHNPSSRTGLYFSQSRAGPFCLRTILPDSSLSGAKVTPAFCPLSLLCDSSPHSTSCFLQRLSSVVLRVLFLGRCGKGSKLGVKATWRPHGLDEQGMVWDVEAKSLCASPVGMRMVVLQVEI